MLDLHSAPGFALPMNLYRMEWRCILSGLHGAVMTLAKCEVRIVYVVMSVVRLQFW